MSARTSPSATTLRGYWLILARVLWVGLAAVTLGAFAFSVPVRYSQLSHPSASVRAALEEMGLSPDGYALYNVGLDAAFISVFAVVAIVIFLRRSGDPVALLVATMLVLWGTWNDLFVATPRAIEGLHPLLDAAVALLSYAGYIAWMLFFYLFPSGRFVPRWTRWFALCWVLFSGSWLSTPFGPPTWPIALFSAAVTVLWGSFLVAQVFRYARLRRHPASADQVGGVRGSLSGSGLPDDHLHRGSGGEPPAGSSRAEDAEHGAEDAFALLIPLSRGIAMLRSRLFDINVVINRTLVYGSLTGALVALYFGGVVGFQWVFVALAGHTSTLAVVASTLAIAALFNPLRRRIQSFIDRRFYRSKYDARKTLEAFSAKLRNETNLEALNNELVRVVTLTMQPTHASLWLRPAPDRSAKRLADR